MTCTDGGEDNSSVIMLLTTKTKSLWDLNSFARKFIPLKLGILRMRTREPLHFVHYVMGGAQATARFAALVIGTRFFI